MALSSTQIAARLAGQSSTDCRNLLFDMLFESLSPRQQNIYCFIYDNPNCTSMDIKAQFPQSAQNNIDNELMRLRKLDVLKPFPVSGDGPFYYRWQVKLVAEK